MKKYAVYDGPGIRTTIFAKGCPLRCSWCSNPETWTLHPQIYFKAEKCREYADCVEVCPVNAVTMDNNNKVDRKKCTHCMKCVEECGSGALTVVGEKVSPGEVMEEIEKDIVFYRRSGGGVTISGGEPLFQPHFTSKIFQLCHEENIHSVLDTSGYGDPEDVKRVLRYTDLVLLDIKHMDPETHKEHTGVSNRRILKNAELMTNESEVRISLPLVGNFNNSKENIKKTIEFASSLGVEYIDVEPFHKLGEKKYEMLGIESRFPDFEEISAQEVNEVLEMIRSKGLKATKNRTM